jgi:hypothetical protein
MKRSRFSEEQIIQILKEQEAGQCTSFASRDEAENMIGQYIDGF